MIKRVKVKVREKFNSLYLRLFLVILVGIIIASSVYLTLHFVTNYYISSYYVSAENRKAREEEYIEDLREYATRLGLSSESTTELAKWAQQNRYVYLLIYKDNELFFTSDTKPEPPVTDAEDENTPPDDTEDGEGKGDEVDGDVTEGDEGELGDETTDKTEKEDENSGTVNPGGSGITVDYPTREELFKYAEENDLYPIELEDGTLFASLAEFTEYLYYDVANITSIVVAMIVLAIVILNYFRKIISRIKRLEHDVNIVSGGDMDHMIMAGGYDEISKLSVNVENMRKSILYNLEKEREARGANTELITAMSHDIRTPLTVLLGYLEMMRAEAGEGSVMQGYIDASERTAMRLKQLSDDMFKNSLAFGNTEEGIDLEEYNAKMLIEQLLSEHILLMRENGYKLNYATLGEEIGDEDVILTDAPNLMRIIDNIFSNIYKYADLAEEVRMTVENNGGLLRFTCSNTPICDTSKAESNGIGLKTCKRLARFVANDFSYGMVDGRFVTTLEVKKQNANRKDG